MDVTAKKQTDEERKAHLYALESMERVSQAIQATDDLEPMLDHVLDAVLEIFGCDRAVLGTWSDDLEPTSLVILAKRARPGFAGDSPGVAHAADSSLAAMARVLRTTDGPFQFLLESAPTAVAQVMARFRAQSVLTMTAPSEVGDPKTGYHVTIAQGSYPRVWTELEVRLFQQIGRRLDDALHRISVLRVLRESEARLEEAQRVAHVGHWEFDPDTDGLICSAEAYRILGLEPQRGPLIGGFRERVHPEDRLARERGIHNLYAGASATEWEYRVVRPSGEVRVVHLRGNVTRDDSGRPRRTFGTVQDVTEQRLAEAALRNAQRELAHVARVSTMAEIGSSIAHEVNQPLAAIVMNANASLRWLDARLPDLGEVRKAVQAILGDAHRASQVVERIRTLVRRDAPDAKPLNVNELIEDTLALLRVELARNEISVQTELTAELPEAVGDRVQVQQVLVNLILNARDAMESVPKTARVLTIRTRLDQAEGVTIEVRDSGKGLDPEQVDRLFEPFYSTKPGGLGMGLAISRSIVKAHRGRLWAAPSDGPGATLIFTVPVAAGRP